MKNRSGNVLFKLSDLRIKHQCQQCQHWHTAHAVPYGDPLAFLVTGYCPQCGATYLSLRHGSDEGVGGAAQQLAQHFLQAAPVMVQPGMQTKH